MLDSSKSPNKNRASNLRNAWDPQTLSAQQPRSSSRTWTKFKPFNIVRARTTQQISSSNNTKLRSTCRRQPVSTRGGLVIEGMWKFATSRRDGRSPNGARVRPGSPTGKQTADSGRPMMVGSVIINSIRTRAIRQQRRRTRPGCWQSRDGSGYCAGTELFSRKLDGGPKAIVDANKNSLSLQRAMMGLRPTRASAKPTKGRLRQLRASKRAYE